MVLVLSPGVAVTVTGEQHNVPAGHVVYLEARRLLFAEGGAQAGYCLPARTVAAILGHYIDDFIAALLADL